MRYSPVERSSPPGVILIFLWDRHLPTRSPPPDEILTSCCDPHILMRTSSHDTSWWELHLIMRASSHDEILITWRDPTCWCLTSWWDPLSGWVPHRFWSASVRVYSYKQRYSKYPPACFLPLPFDEILTFWKDPHLLVRISHFLVRSPSPDEFSPDCRAPLFESTYVSSAIQVPRPLSYTLASRRDPLMLPRFFSRWNAYLPMRISAADDFRWDLHLLVGSPSTASINFLVRFRDISWILHLLARSSH